MKQQNMRLAAVLVTIAFIASVLTATPVLAHKGDSDNSGPGSLNSDLDDEDEMQEETEIKAFTFDGKAQVKVEVELNSETSDAVKELFDKIKALTKEQIEDLLRMEEKQVEAREDMEVKAEGQKIELELRFTVDSTDKSAIVDAIMDKLGAITLEDLNSAVEMEDEDDEAIAEIEVRDGDNSGPGNSERRLEIKIRGDETEVKARGFSESFMTELEDIISQLLALLRGE